MVFANAKVLDNAAKTGKAKKEKSSENLPVRRLAHLDAIIKAAEAAKAVEIASLGEKVWDLALTKRGGDGSKPESFNGVENEAVVNLQIRKRGTNSALNEEEAKILRDYEIEPKKETVTPQLYAINPEYAENVDLMKKVEKALEKLGLPDDFIVIQEEKSKLVVDEDMEKKAWKSGNREVLDIVSCLAFKPMMTEINPKALGETIRDIFDIEEHEITVEQVLHKIEHEKKKVEAAALTKRPKKAALLASKPATEKKGGRK